jgi:hypothetical protein
MTDYKGIKGFTIPNVSSDPANPMQGQIWYNSTSGTLKAAVPGVGAWASGGNMPDTYGMRFGFGTQTAGMCAGGAPGDTTKSQTYNGTSWTEVNDINTGRANEAGNGSGTTSAGLIYRNTTEAYNGTSWTEVNAMNTNRGSLSGNGTQAATIAMGGSVGPTYQVLTESWNGTSWTEVNDLNTARSGGTSLGVQGATFYAAGYTGSSTTAKVEEWNGTSWTETTDLNQARCNQLSRGGTITDGLVAGGYDSSRLGNTETWNGTSWTEAADLAVARYAVAGQGTGSAAFAAGGNNPSDNYTASTEEWSEPDSATVTITTS